MSQRKLILSDEFAHLKVVALYIAIENFKNKNRLKEN